MVIAVRLAEIEKLDKDFLTVAEVAGCIHCEPQLIRDEAGKDPKYLGFPITKFGHSWRIPKEGFVRWCKGEIPVMQIVSSNQLFKDFEITKGKMDDIFLSVTGKSLSGGAQ